MNGNRPVCHQCQHFYITWDRHFPNGCRAYGIKSKYLPAMEVFRATGKGCLGYMPKKRPQTGRGVEKTYPVISPGGFVCMPGVNGGC